MKDITGQKFGRLTAIELLYKRKNYKPYWKFICDCGTTTEKDIYSVMCGAVQSCGCLQREHASKHAKKMCKGNKKFSIRSSDRFFVTWRNMLRRCADKKAADYYRYGGKGIKVCQEWQDFEVFKADMYNSYNKHCIEFGVKQTTLDRIDFSGNYSPKNCRWATYIEQGMNTSTNRLIKFRGKTQPLKQWCYDLELNYGTTWSRLKRGWSIEKTLTTPKKGR